MNEWEQAIIDFALQYPKVAAVVFAVGAARLTIKPIISGIELAIKETPSQKDDEFWAKVVAHKVYKTFWWILNYTASIKKPQKS